MFQVSNYKQVDEVNFGYNKRHMSDFCDFRLPSRFKLDLHSFAILRSLQLYFRTDVSGYTMYSPSLEDRTDTLDTNVENKPKIYAS